MTDSKTNKRVWHAHILFSHVHDVRAVRAVGLFMQNQEVFWISSAATVTISDIRTLLPLFPNMGVKYKLIYDCFFSCFLDFPFAFQVFSSWKPAPKR